MRDTEEMEMYNRKYVEMREFLNVWKNCILELLPVLFAPNASIP